MEQTLLMTLLILTSGVGVITLTRRWFGQESDARRTLATIGGVVAWLTLTMLVWLGPSPNTAMNGTDACTGGSEVDVELQRPLVLFKTRTGGDYLAIDAGTPGKLRITPQDGGGEATVNLSTGQASANGSQIWLCEAPR